MSEQINNNETAKKSFSWKRSLITSIFVLLAAVVIGGAVWYIMNQNATDINNSNNKSINAMQTNINSLKSKIASLEAKTKATTSTVSTDWKSYTNSDYGFKLTFTEKFKGYTVKKETAGTWGAPFLNEYEFMLPTTDTQFTATGNNPASVFDIFVYSDSNYQAIPDNQGPKPTMIKSLDGNTYAYLYTSEWPSDWGMQQSDAATVISTFGF